MRITRGLFRLWVVASVVWVVPLGVISSGAASPSGFSSGRFGAIMHHGHQITRNHFQQFDPVSG
jgi:hypothetical protein